LKKRNLILASLLGLLGAHVLCSPCKAMMRIPGRFPNSVLAVRTPIKDIDLIPHSEGYARGFDISTVQPVSSVMFMRTEDVSRYIPTDLSPTSNGGSVAAKIGERGLNAWLNSPSMKNTSFVKGAQSLEKNMASDMNVGGDEPDSIKHSFKFGVKAAQSRAQLEYAGLMNANVSYQVAASTFNVEVREPVAMLQTDLVFNHINSRDDQRDILSVRWNW
jgi:hypothetical protein